MNKFYEEGAEGGGGDAKVTNVLATAPAATADAPATGPVVKESWLKGWANEDGTVNKERYQHLPEELAPLQERAKQLQAQWEATQVAPQQAGTVQGTVAPQGAANAPAAQQGQPVTTKQATSAEAATFQEGAMANANYTVGQKLTMNGQTLVVGPDRKWRKA